MMFKLTYTLSTISSISWWTGSTFVPTGIGWRWKIGALNSCITWLTITLAGINVTVTEPSCVSPLTCTTHVYKLAVSVDCVTFFRWHTLTSVVAGAHVNCWTPCGTCTFVVSSNEWQIELQLETKVIVSSCDISGAKWRKTWRIQLNLFEFWLARLIKGNSQSLLYYCKLQSWVPEA